MRKRELKSGYKLTLLFTRHRKKLERDHIHKINRGCKASFIYQGITTRCFHLIILFSRKLYPLRKLHQSFQRFRISALTFHLQFTNMSFQSHIFTISVIVIQFIRSPCFAKRNQCQIIPIYIRHFLTA